MSTPLQDALEDLHARLSALDEGAVATYIPELGNANPDHFAICIATVDGHVYAVGDAGVPFTIQSISKPFVYGLALDDIGDDAVLDTVGVEPSGEAFNAISLESDTGRPRNPMINAGAIATASLVTGHDNEAKLQRTIDALSRFAGRTLEVDDAVYGSERSTGHRNRAIAYLLRNAGIIGDDVDDVVDRYFTQCSVLVTCRDLAVMAASLANGGENPCSRKRVITHEHVENVLSVMSTCGMYDYAGSWLYRVGMPAKSGVSGGVIAVLPGQLGIGVYSPRLDAFGNSVRGVAACETLSREFGLHLLRPPVSLGSVVLMTHSLAEVTSKRRRTRDEMRCLAERGGAVRICRLQGPLAFSTAEVALRNAADGLGECSTVVFDWQRVPTADEAACRLFGRFARRLLGAGATVVFAGLRNADEWKARIFDEAKAPPDGDRLRAFPSIDLALEWCEDRVLASAGVVRDIQAEMPLTAHAMFAALTAPEIEALRPFLWRAVFAPGDTIVRYGDPADAVYFVVAGSVSINLHLVDGRRHRLATMGAGSVFGEFALVEEDVRTADVEAETPVVCYMLNTADTPQVERAAPGVLRKLVENVARDLADRLRRADREIAALVP
ncbi:MAG TPA: glutaminase A [Dehalococcoidia bacterium]